MRRRTRQIVYDLAMSIRERDIVTFNHSCRVEMLAYRFARSLGWPRTEAYDLALAGLAHDLGKTWLENGILHKDAALSTDEREDMQRHSEIGATLLHAFGASDAVIIPVLYHHERFDGKGYPKGLTGESIPLSARLLAIVDVFDALASPRPYKDSLTVQATSDYIVSESGRYFDPAAVVRFVEFLATVTARTTAATLPYRQT